LNLEDLSHLWHVVVDKDCMTAKIIEHKDVQSGNQTGGSTFALKTDQEVFHLSHVIVYEGNTRHDHKANQTPFELLTSMQKKAQIFFN